MGFKLKLDWHENFAIVVLLSMIILAIRSRWVSGKTYIKLWNKASITKLVFGLIAILISITMLAHIFASKSNDDLFISLSGGLMIAYLLFTGISMPRLCENGILTSTKLLAWSKVKAIEWKGSYLSNISPRSLISGRYISKSLDDDQMNILVIQTQETTHVGIHNVTYKVVIPISKKGIVEEIIRKKLTPGVDA